MMSRFLFFKYDFLSAFEYFKRKWVHSVLSVLGIVISISSIIIMISISDGAKQKTLENIRNLGINTIRVLDKPESTLSNSNLSEGLNQKDYNLINNIINKYGYSAMVYKFKSKSIFFKNGDTKATVIGSNENFKLIEQLDILKGRPLLKRDVQSFSTVAMISKDIAYKHNIALDDTIIYNDTIYKVISILDTKDNLNNFVVLPYNLVKPSNNVFDEINIFIKDKKHIFLLANKLKDKITQNHSGVKNFSVNVALEIIEKEKDVQNIFNTVLLSIALMSLLTGGMSVMNAVLSNINEQTREIGLKIALGATQGRIVVFYLLYTIILTIVGGFLGGFVGYIILFVLMFFSKLYIVFSIQAFVLGIAMSIMSGLLFGIYPALRASKIEPMIALREF